MAKKQKTTLNNWDEVNTALADLAALEVFVNENENDMNDEIQKIKNIWARTEL